MCGGGRGREGGREEGVIDNRLLVGQIENWFFLMQQWRCLNNKFNNNKICWLTIEANDYGKSWTVGYCMLPPIPLESMLRTTTFSPLWSPCTGIRTCPPCIAICPEWIGVAMATCEAESHGPIGVGVAICAGVWSTVTVAVLAISLSILDAKKDQVVEKKTKQKRMTSLPSSRTRSSTCFDAFTMLHVFVPVFVLTKASTVTSIVAATAGLCGISPTVPAILEGKKNMMR